MTESNKQDEVRTVEGLQALIDRYGEACCRRGQMATGDLAEWEAQDAKVTGLRAQVSVALAALGASGGQQL